MKTTLQKIQNLKNKIKHLRVETFKDFVTKNIFNHLPHIKSMSTFENHFKVQEQHNNNNFNINLHIKPKDTNEYRKFIKHEDIRLQKSRAKRHKNRVEAQQNN